MYLFRTSRILQLLLAAALTAGPVLPLVQVICGMESPMAESHSMLVGTVAHEGSAMVSRAAHESAGHVHHAIHSGADAENPIARAVSPISRAMSPCDGESAVLSAGSSIHDCPACEVVREAYRTCCPPADLAVVTALPVKYSDRLLADFTAAVRPPGGMGAPHDAGVPATSGSYAVPIPSPANHQAFLATFLI